MVKFWEIANHSATIWSLCIFVPCSQFSFSTSVLTSGIFFLIAPLAITFSVILRSK